MSSSKTPNFELNRWDYSDKPTMPEFNRDNEIVDAELKRLWDSKADSKKGDLAVYVSKGGSNATANGTQTNPFGTIQAAIDYAGGRVAARAKHILIGDGVYEEAVTALGFDRLVIRSMSENRNGVIIRPPAGSENGVIINGIALCTIRNLTIRMQTGENALFVMGGSFEGRDLALIAEGDVVVGAILTMGASGMIKESEISGFDRAIRTTAGSSLYAENNTGSRNRVVHNAQGSIICHYGTAPSGTTAVLANAGGQVLS